MGEGLGPYSHWIHSLGYEIGILVHTQVGEQSGERGGGRGRRSWVGVLPEANDGHLF